MIQILSNCPVCGDNAQGYSNKCRMMSSHVLLCRSLYCQDTNGWKYKKVDSTGTWSVFYQSSGTTGAAYKAVIKEEASEPNYDALRRLHEITSLSNNHQKELTDRGVKNLRRFTSFKREDYHNNFDLSSLPGKVIPGLLIPTTDHDNKITGYQIKPDNKSMPKYIWLSSESKARIKGELPIQCAIGVNKKIVILCEGTLKPVVARDRLGYTFIGASGGNWTSSKSLINACLKALNPDKLYIAPDAGAMANYGVWSRVEKASKYWGASVLNWGQLKDKDDCDIDEIDELML